MPLPLLNHASSSNRPPAAAGSALVVVVWCVCVAFGFGALMVYSQTTGEVRTPPSAPVLSSHWAPSEKPWRLAMGIHPKCPCTLAAAAELERLMRHCEERLRCDVFSYMPAQEHDDDAEWRETRLIERFKAIPGVQVTPDPAGALSRRLGIDTSGGVVLYDASGTARYYGGLTRARNHEGASVGSDAILRWISGETPGTAHAPTYGCRILPSQEATR